MEEKEGRV
jgi:hypothetical protein